MQGYEGAFYAHVQLVKDHAALNLSEADTRAYLIDPILRILGYESVSDLRREVSVPATKESLDYALLVDGKPRVIVEAKAVQLSIADQHAAQCVQYASVLGVRWCLITNGRQWALFDAYAKVPLEEKRIVEVRLDGDALAARRAWEVLSLFSKEAQIKANPLTQLLIERVVADELTTADSKTVASLRQAVRRRFGEQVSGTAVVALLKRVFQPEPVPPPIPAPSELRPARVTTPRGTTPVLGESPVAGRKRPTLGDLTAVGLLPTDGAVLELRVHGITHVGQVKEGGIEVNGFLYRTPSAAASAVTGRASDGWREWNYKGETLDQLRQRLSKPSPGSVQNGIS